MRFGQLSFHISMLCAAIKFGCETALRVGARAVEILRPIQHENGRAYANLYFKFTSSEAFLSHNRRRLRVPNFSLPLHGSCTQFHTSVQQKLPEARIDFGKLRQGKIRAAVEVYPNDDVLVMPKQLSIGFTSRVRLRTCRQEGQCPLKFKLITSQPSLVMLCFPDALVFGNHVSCVVRMGLAAVQRWLHLLPQQPHKHRQQQQLPLRPWLHSWQRHLSARQFR